MERCTRCILPRTYAAVKFGDDGTCNLCAEYPGVHEQERASLATRRAELDRVIAQVRSEGGRYDCIVLMSGGLDSTYVAYLMRRQFGLRVLGLNIDNGYRTPLALENMEETARNLEIDLVTLKPQPVLYRKAFAHFFKTCGYFCTVCNAVGYIVVGSFAAREARLRGSKPLVVGGWSRKYEYQPGLSVLSMKAFGDKLREDPALYEEVRESPLVDPEVFDDFVSIGDIRQLASTSAGTEDARLRLVQLPTYLDWDYRRIVATLKEEVGWKKQEHGHEAHFDCWLAPIQEHLKHRRFGFSQETIKNSVLVREGRMSRDDALRKIELEQIEEPPVLRETLAQWDLTVDEIPWDTDWC